jgi:hypothetical protein
VIGGTDPEGTPGDAGGAEMNGRSRRVAPLANAR